MTDFTGDDSAVDVELYCPKYLTINLNNTVFQAYKFTEYFGGNYSKQEGYNYKTNENIIIAYPKSAVRLTRDPIQGRQYILKSLTSEATPSATQFFKRSYKISHNPGL